MIILFWISVKAFLLILLNKIFNDYDRFMVLKKCQSVFEHFKPPSYWLKNAFKRSNFVSLFLTIIHEANIFQAKLSSFTTITIGQNKNCQCYCPLSDKSQKFLSTTDSVAKCFSSNYK